MEADQIRSFFAKDIYAMETTGIEILEVKDNYAKTHLSVSDKHRNADNVVMGGCIYTLADFTFALAANCGNNLTTTLSSNIVFNSPAPNNELFAETELVKSGRTVCTYLVKVTDEKERLIATVTCVGFRKA